MANVFRPTFGAAVNYADAAAPTLSSASIPAAGTSLSIVFSKAVKQGAGGNGGFTIAMSGGAVTLTYSSGANTATWVYTTSRTIDSSETCSDFDYTQPGNGVESLYSGVDLATFTNQQASVTNNSTVSGGSASFTDNFTRTNADPMSDPASGGTWTTGSTYLGTMRILSNKLAGSTGATTKVARVATPAFAADQRATFTLADIGTYQGVLVRSQSASDTSGYYCQLRNDNTTIRVYTYADDGSGGFGTYTQLGADITVSAMNIGDTLGFGVVGTTLTVYRNGVSVATRTDSTFTSGQPAMQIYGDFNQATSFTAIDE